MTKVIHVSFADFYLSYHNEILTINIVLSNINIKRRIKPYGDDIMI
ncbi:hypothetical protein KN1_27870 [Stygiolobus caldivivus]|uniref:Uncharacterized protein n=1 Tax=Stygiolobus caldivivus TaxID=2824673 RepID=A0A8D5ZKK7_9CREN|nr:hypothetical protein KN1_27870 [Stygiolobus caldivivus]